MNRRVFLSVASVPLLCLSGSRYTWATETGFEVAVVGAHLSGLPLNYQLVEQHAQYVEATTTTPDYRLYLLAGSEPLKPGLLRVADGTGTAIQVEIWSMSADGFGRFTAAVPPPLSIGTVRLAGGRMVKGFLVEAEAVKNARDISSFGGWRNYLAKGGQ